MKKIGIVAEKLKEENITLASIDIIGNHLK